MRRHSKLLLGTLLLLSAATVASAQDALLAANLVDFGVTGTGQLANATATVGMSWSVRRDAGSTVFSLNTTPIVNGAEAWYVDTYPGDEITVTLDLAPPVTQPLFFIERMDDADLDFGVIPGVEAFIVEQRGGMVESGANFFTAPSGGDAATGTIGLTGSYSRVVFTISSASGRDVIHIAVGAASGLLEPPYFSEVTLGQSNAYLQLANLLIGTTTTVQRADSLLSPSWTNVAQFISFSSSTNLSDTAEIDRAFYRFMQE